MNRTDNLWPVANHDAQIPLHVLIVDDRLENLVSLEAILEDCGAHLIRALSGKEALERLLEYDIALVLLDIAMPGMDGFEVADLMRSTRRTRHIPIIFLTAYMCDETATLRGYFSGAIDYLYKPIDPIVLRCKVNIFLDLHRRQQQLVCALRRIDDQRAYYESILDAEGEGVLGLDASGLITFANPAAMALLVSDEAQLIGQDITGYCSHSSQTMLASQLLDKVLSQKETVRIDDATFIKSNGLAFSASLVCSPITGAQPGAVLVFQDTSLRKALEEQLTLQAHTDCLTGLHNRTSFKNLLQAAINRNSRLQKHLAVLFIDLDHFKQINDCLGHEAGDQLLEGVAQELLQSIRHNDVVARLGGDEFTIILEELNDPEDAAVIARKILQSLAHPFQVDARGTQITISASIGIATHPSCGHDMEKLLQAADLAMYRAKKNGRNLYEFFTAEMNTKAQARLALEQSLRLAVAQKELSLYYQPQIDLRTKRLRGFEALLRWHHPSAGNIAPSTFVPLLEETGLMVLLGAWMMDTAFRERAHWHNSKLVEVDCIIAINLSPRQFADPALLETIQSTLASNQITPTMVEIEITEACLMGDVDAARKTLNGIKKLGLHISIDDFGTGYSSLSYLKALQLDALKIDRSFVANMTNRPEDAAIATSIVQLAHHLGLQAIAEGVETASQLSMLEEMACDLAQGFLFSPALPADQLCLYLQKEHPEMIAPKQG